ncbi:hypothetical protein [Nitrospira sp. Kam-Ns4a]
MQRFHVLAGMALVLALFAGGCVSRQEYRQTQLLTVYSSMDSMALVYSDPVATSPLNDHPLRWVGFLLHPIGVGVDSLINRPLYSAASGAPAVTGFNSEDAMLDAQRLSRARR